MSDQRRQLSPLLCRDSCRLLFADIPKGTDRNAELKRRLRMEEAGDIHDLAQRVLGQQHIGCQAAEATPKGTKTQTKEQRGKRARSRGKSSRSFHRKHNALDCRIHTWQFGPLSNSSNRSRTSHGSAEVCMGNIPTMGTHRPRVSGLSLSWSYRVGHYGRQSKLCVQSSPVNDQIHGH